MRRATTIEPPERLTVPPERELEALPLPELAAIELQLGPGSGQRTVEVQPPFSFRPLTLVLWSCSRGATVYRFGTALLGPVPAVLFEAEEGRRAFDAMFRQRSDGAFVFDARHRLPECYLMRCFRFRCESLAPGEPFPIELDGSFERGILLGRTPPLDPPELEAAPPSSEAV